MSTITADQWLQLARVGGFVAVVLLVVKVRPWRLLLPWLRGRRG